MSFDPIPYLKGSSMDMVNTAATADVDDKTHGSPPLGNPQKLFDALKLQKTSFNEIIQKEMAAFDQKLKNQMMRIKLYLLEDVAKDYERHKNIAIGTGAGGIVALIALVTCAVLAILFPHHSLPFFIGAAWIALGTSSIVYGVRAADCAGCINGSTSEHLPPPRPVQIH